MGVRRQALLEKQLRQPVEMMRMTETKAMSVGVLLAVVLLLLLATAEAGEEQRGQALAQGQQPQSDLGEAALRQIREVKEKGDKKNIRKRKRSKPKNGRKKSRVKRGGKRKKKKKKKKKS